MFKFFDQITDKRDQKRILELEARIRLLEKNLIHDALTGLKTRRYFEEEAGVYVNVTLQSHDAFQRREWFGFKQLSFAFFDIDHFKRINDTLGHAAGDEVLKTVSKVILDSVREGDLVARWGGEEIVLMLVGASVGEALQKVEEIREKIASLRFDAYPDLRITTSAGVTSLDPENDKAGELDKIMKRADEALYAAKGSGRNKSVVWSKGDYRSTEM